MRNAGRMIPCQVKQCEAKAEDKKVLHSERYFGSVQRSLAPPCPLDEAKGKATCENGVLILTLPMSSSGSTKSITVE